MLTVKNISVRYSDYTAVKDLSFQVTQGQWLMLVGPNGAGKSTLVRAIERAVPFGGEILLSGKRLQAYKPQELARRIGVLSQHNHVSYAFTVGEIVKLGRYAHQKGFLSKKDEGGERAIQRALLLTGMLEHKDKSILELSGGEVQRAFLAQVFAQEPEILILDEPANHLDLVYQKNVFELIDEWRKMPGRAVISVVHDLGLAKKYGTHAVLMDKGTAVSYGTAEEVLSPENLESVYRMDVYEWMQDLLKRWNC